MTNPVPNSNSTPVVSAPSKMEEKDLDALLNDVLDEMNNDEGIDEIAQESPPKETDTTENPNNFEAMLEKALKDLNFGKMEAQDSNINQSFTVPDQDDDSMIKKMMIEMMKQSIGMQVALYKKSPEECRNKAEIELQSVSILTENREDMFLYIQPGSKKPKWIKVLPDKLDDKDNKLLEQLIGEMLKDFNEDNPLNKHLHKLVQEGKAIDSCVDFPTESLEESGDDGKRKMQMLKESGFNELNCKTMAKLKNFDLEMGLVSIHVLSLNEDLIPLVIEALGPRLETMTSDFMLLENVKKIVTEERLKQINEDLESYFSKLKKT